MGGGRVSAESCSEIPLRLSLPFLGADYNRVRRVDASGLLDVQKIEIR